MGNWNHLQCSLGSPTYGQVGANQVFVVVCRVQSELSELSARCVHSSKSPPPRYVCTKIVQIMFARYRIESNHPILVVGQTTSDAPRSRWVRGVRE